MDDSPDFREMLEAKVVVAEDGHKRALRAYELARDALQSSYSDLKAYRKALEALTRDSETPYVAPYLPHPFEGVAAECPPTPEPKIEPVKLQKPEKITKKGVVLEALAKANGAGMKLDDVLKAVRDAPIKLNKADLYRALPRLVDEEKAWRDKNGYYHAGEPTKGDPIEDMFS
ncbi:MAG TPA: hypothetical protein VK388_01845 [Pyrinomonadaceae bacterium]|nr:hypothetical protein [Pyrinomonadaceae bacterium]